MLKIHRPIYNLVQFSSAVILLLLATRSAKALNTLVPARDNRPSFTAHLSPSQAELTKRLNEDKLRAAAPTQVTVELNWKYHNFPFKMKVFELAPSANESLFATRNDDDYRRHYPILRELPTNENGHVLNTTSGRNIPLLLVFENPTDEPVYFYAAPHSVYPAELSLGMKFFCLCTGKAYRSAPHSSWTRVINLRLSGENRSSFYRLAHDIFRADRKKTEANLENESE